MRKTGTARETVLAATLCISLAFALGGCKADEASDVETAANEATEEAVESFTPHGANYGKSETVAVTTNLDGTIQGIAVTEWIKNPDGLQTIVDETSLSGIVVQTEDVTYSQADGEIVWETGGQDVKYAGTTDGELPFAISYEYRLDGEIIDPSALNNAKGQLEVTILYENRTSGQINVGGATRDVQVPYMMASIISFDPEHARNIQVSNGTVVDMNGTLMAVGIGMPGLEKTLGVEGQVDLPESVVITAEVLGFDMPNITTVATAEGLEALSGKVGDADSLAAKLFGKVGGFQEGLTMLSTGISGLSDAIGQIKSAQEGLALLGIALQTACGSASTAIASAQTQLDATISTLEQLANGKTCTCIDVPNDGEPTSSNPAAASECEKCVLDGAVEQLKASSADLAQAEAVLNGGFTKVEADGTSTEVPSAIEMAESLNQGTAGMATALGNVQTGMEKMSEATGAMDEGIASAIAQLQSAIYSKTDLVEALGAWVDERGAFCGSADGMPVTTTFTVTARAE